MIYITEEEVKDLYFLQKKKDIRLYTELTTRDIHMETIINDIGKTILKINESFKESVVRELCSDLLIDSITAYTKENIMGNIKTEVDLAVRDFKRTPITSINCLVFDILNSLFEKDFVGIIVYTIAIEAYLNKLKKR